MKSMGIRAVVGLGAVSLWSALALAQSNPAVGLWRNEEPNRTIIIRTTEDGGKLVGKVEKVLKNNVEDKTGVCSKCTGEGKDKPVVGMTIIWDMQKDGDKYAGGKILEPDTGKIYNCKIEPVEGGKKLSVRGSIAFFGKTQTWIRAD